MVFKIDDIYTTSGSTQLYNSWTPHVSKFDTSTFYNWEQDNLPLYDLEERTYELWEQAGFPTSAIPGLSLTVSADAPAASLAADSNIFTSVSSCLAALPKVIRFPVLIEVCNFGDLGIMEFHNIRMEEAGSIEIINRAFTKVYNASGTSTTLVASPTYNKSHPLISKVTAPDASATLFSSLNTFITTSSISLSAPVMSGVTDIRLAATNSVLYPQTSLRAAPLSVSLANAFATFNNGVANEFGLTPYEHVDYTAIDDTIATLDNSSINQFDSSLIERTNITNTDNVGGAIYLNLLTKASVKNCDGPIYIRNFMVDGESSVAGGRDNGFLIVNSDVVLENCTAIRARKAGFLFRNSKVVLSRLAASYRNYTLATVTTRAPKTGIGFHAINSDISVSALIMQPTEAAEVSVVGDYQASGHDVKVIASRNYAGIKLDNSKLTGGFQRLAPTSENTGGIVAAELNTDAGIIAINSEIDLQGLLDIYGNDTGIRAIGSRVTYENLCVDYNTSKGVASEGSVMEFNSPIDPTTAGQASRKQVDFLQNGQHLDIRKQSEFGFKRKNHIPATYGNMSFVSAHGTLDWSGAPQSNLPAISVEDNSVADLVHCKLLARDATTTVSNSVDHGLAARAVNNSKLSFFGSKNGATFIWGPPGYAKQQYAAGLYAGNGSEVNLFGPTLIAQFGVDVLAENNSVINIEPPRVRSTFGYEVSGFDLSSQDNHASIELHSTRACLVVNGNSVLNMNDLGSFAYHWPGSTAGDLLTTAQTDYQSAINSSGLTAFGSLQFFPNPQNSLAITENKLDNILEIPSTPLAAIPNFPTFTARTGMNTLLVSDDPLVDSTDTTARGRVSKGGVCVRAVGDSVVNVNNVHFPTGNDGGTMDDIYYNASGGDCSRLMIWNLADTSRLTGSLLSVSGEYPSECDYHGPSAMYMSATTTATIDWSVVGHGVPASGAPSATPDTGTLSVLDAFGAGSSVWVVPSGVSLNSAFERIYPVSAGAHPNEFSDQAEFLESAGINVSSTATRQYGGDHVSKNTGPFRIYWSPRSSSKLLLTDLSGARYGSYPHTGAYSGVLGPAYQIFAQGYNLSASVSAVLNSDGTSVSGTYPELLRFNNPDASFGGTDGLWTSGFYYCKDFVDDNPTQCMLDESAADTFANSKNATLGSSGRPKKVTIYRSRQDGTSTIYTTAGENQASEAYQGDVSGTLGFKSSNVFDLRRDN